MAAASAGQQELNGAGFRSLALFPAPRQLLLQQLLSSPLDQAKSCPFSFQMMGNVHSQSYMQWHFATLQSFLSVALRVSHKATGQGNPGLPFQYSAYLQEYRDQLWKPMSAFTLLEVQRSWDGVLWSWGKGVLMGTCCLGREAGVTAPGDGASLTASLRDVHGRGEDRQQEGTNSVFSPHTK